MLVVEEGGGCVWGGEYLRGGVVLFEFGFEFCVFFSFVGVVVYIVDLDSDTVDKFL